MLAPPLASRAALPGSSDVSPRISGLGLPPKSTWLFPIIIFVKMAPHPSLTAPPIKADPIKPVEKMGRNEPCWCRSGLKYKRCHFRREEQKPINVFEVEAKLMAELREGYCSHPGPTADP
jgi:hypothetical protein